MSYKFKNIAVTGGTYRSLKNLGRAGDSFNDVIQELVEFRKRNDGLAKERRAR